MIVRTVGPGGQTVPGPGQPQGQRVVMTTQGQQIIRTGKQASPSLSRLVQTETSMWKLSTWKIPFRIPQKMFPVKILFNCIYFNTNDLHII